MLLLELVCKFLTYDELCHTCDALQIRNRKAICDFYFNETLYLTPEEKLCIAENRIPQPLWMRMYGREFLLNAIIVNEFISPKLKVQMYNGVKKNIPSLLKIYNEYYPLVVGKSIEFFADIRKIIEFLPIRVDRYEFKLNEMGEFMIYYDGKCVGRNFFSDTVKIIEHYGLDHVITMIRTPIILESISLSGHDISPREGIHRRPKCKIRKII